MLGKFSREVSVIIFIQFDRLKKKFAWHNIFVMEIIAICITKKPALLYRKIKLLRGFNRSRHYQSSPFDACDRTCTHQHTRH